MYVSDSSQAQVRYTLCKNNHMPRKELWEDSILHVSEHFQTWDLILLHIWVVLVCSVRKDLLAKPQSISQVVLWATQDELLHPQTHSLPPLKQLLTNWALSWETAAKVSFAHALQPFYPLYGETGTQTGGAEDTLCQLLFKSIFSLSSRHEEYWGAVYLVFTRDLGCACWQVLQSSVTCRNLYLSSLCSNSWDIPYPQYNTTLTFVCNAQLMP